MRFIFGGLLAIIAASTLAATLSACGGAYADPQDGIQSDIDATLGQPATSVGPGSRAADRVTR
jgi:hypothetical protein